MSWGDEPGGFGCEKAESITFPGVIGSGDVAGGWSVSGVNKYSFDERLGIGVAGGRAVGATSSDRGSSSIVDGGKREVTGDVRADPGVSRAAHSTEGRCPSEKMPEFILNKVYISNEA